MTNYMVTKPRLEKLKSIDLDTLTLTQMRDQYEVLLESLRQPRNRRLRPEVRRQLRRVGLSIRFRSSQLRSVFGASVRNEGTTR